MNAWWYNTQIVFYLCLLPSASNEQVFVDDLVVHFGEDRIAQADFDAIMKYTYKIADKRAKGNSIESSYYEGDFLTKRIIAGEESTKQYPTDQLNSIINGDVHFPEDADSRGKDGTGLDWTEVHDTPIPTITPPRSIMENYVALRSPQDNKEYHSRDGSLFLGLEYVPDPDHVLFETGALSLMYQIHSMWNIDEGLLLNTPHGIIPMCSKDVAENPWSASRSSRYLDITTDRETVKWGTDWDEDETVTTLQIGKMLDFFKEAQFVTVDGTSESSARKVFTSVALLKSDPNDENYPGYHVNEYQICLADGEEGGIFRAEPTARAAERDSSQKAVTVTLTFNDEYVTGHDLLYYSEGATSSITQITGGEAYDVVLPRYGCVITRFSTLKKKDWR